MTLPLRWRRLYALLVYTYLRPKELTALRWQDVDLRATGITWRTLRGDDPRHIRQAAGHERYSTTEGYVHAAEVFRGLVGAPFPSLPASLISPEFRSHGGQVRESMASRTGFEPVLQP
jgi:integrase